MIVASENFETDIPKTGWSMIDYSTNDGGTYTMGRRACNVNSGSYSGWLIGGERGGLADHWHAVHPMSVITTVCSYTDCFQHGRRLRPGSLNFNVCVTQWKPVTTFYFYSQQIIPTVIGRDMAIPESSSWQSRTLDLSDTLCGEGGIYSCLGLSSVYIAFDFYSNSSVQYAYGAQVDNIVLRPCNSGTCTGASPQSSAPPLHGKVIRDVFGPILPEFFNFPTAGKTE